MLVATVSGEQSMTTSGNKYDLWCTLPGYSTNSPFIDMPAIWTFCFYFIASDQPAFFFHITDVFEAFTMKCCATVRTSSVSVLFFDFSPTNRTGVRVAAEQSHKLNCQSDRQNKNFGGTEICDDNHIITLYHTEFLNSPKAPPAQCPAVTQTSPTGPTYRTSQTTVLCRSRSFI